MNNGRAKSPAPMLSRPLDRMLASSGIEPANLSAAFCEIPRRDPKTMIGADRIPRAIFQATGIPVTRLTRQSSSILLSLDDRGLIYRESSEDYCFIVLPSEVPEQSKVAAVGRRLGALAALSRGTSIFSDATILGSLDSWAGSSAFLLDPGWTKAAV